VVVGKTCLIKRLLYNTFDERQQETGGIEIDSWSVTVPDGDSVRLHVWDFGGQEILHATHQFFLTERTLYLLVLSGREGHPTQDAEYWLQLIRSFGGQSKVIVALNKYNQHPFDINRGLLLEKYPFVAGFVHTDCREPAMGLDSLRGLVIDHVGRLEHRKAAFPEDWFTIKERLAGMGENFLTWERYRELCQEKGESDLQAQRDLAGFLHVLGIALNYRDDPRLKDTHVLKPRWVTEGIYTLLRAGMERTHQAVVAKTDLARILDPHEYPDSCHDFLLRLMEKFQLCFRMPGDPERYLVPELLGENQPDIRQLLDAPGLGFRYQYEILPEGLLPRFIVQTHHLSEANPEWRWRTGVVLQRDRCNGVVRADARERRVDVHISGPESQLRGVLAVIREKFDTQHRDLKGLAVDERVPIPGEKDVTISYGHLLMLEDEGDEWCRPEGSRQKLRVAELLNGLESHDDRILRRNRQRIQAEMSTMKKHVFLSYCHDNESEVKRLRNDLISAGETVWWDKDIPIGADWKFEIRRAMKGAYAVVLCLSAESEARKAAGIYPEARDAIEAYRQYAPGSNFLYPVRLAECDIPPLEIDGTRTLDRLQYVDLFPDARRREALAALVESIKRSPYRP
jgi:internalin A